MLANETPATAKRWQALPPPPKHTHTHTQDVVTAEYNSAGFGGGVIAVLGGATGVVQVGWRGVAHCSGVAWCGGQVM